MSNSFLFGLLPVSILLVFIMLIVILKMKNKKQIHYAFLFLISFILIWDFGSILEAYYIVSFRESVMGFVYIWFFGLSFVPISILFMGVIFARTEIKFNWRYASLVFLPIISYLVLITNNYHHLFFVKYSFINSEIVYGKYFAFHSAFSYFYIAIGLYYLLQFSIKNSGFFSKQSILIITGILFPLLINMLLTFKIVTLPQYATPITFSFAIILFGLAIFKFDFLNVMPIALQRIVDIISDSFIVVDKDFRIIDFNKPLINTFENVVKFHRKDNLLNIFKSEKFLNINNEEFLNIVNDAIEKKKSAILERHFEYKELNKHYSIEITPMFNRDKHLCTIILLKDITQHKKDLELIQQTQGQLIERERLAALGELTAGMAHEINTPLSAIQANLWQLKSYIEKCRTEVENNEFSLESIKETAAGMIDVAEKAENTSKKIANIINSVRNNTRNLSGENVQVFEVGNVVNDLRTLVAHKLKMSGCELTYEEDSKALIKGDPGKFGQIMSNFIVNSIQAYGETPGTIEVKAQNKENEVLITVTDHGKGIPVKIKDRIFKEMLSTKGAEGTGLGMYISNSIITGNFGGKTWLESEEGKGTIIYISIPKPKD